MRPGLVTATQLRRGGADHKRMHPFAARMLAGILALCAFVALLGAHGLIAAALGALAWFALPDEPLQKRPYLLGDRLRRDPELLEHLRPRG